jgi:PIN domain nuclease of toxin-antitoxin system
LKLLLDTHTLLWWITDDPRLQAPVIAAIESPDSEVWVSIVSLWEIAVKIRSGRMAVDIKDVEREIATIGFKMLAITAQHLDVLIGLPMRHRDPFDHLLIAQAIREGAKLVTTDREIRGYPVDVL